MSKIWEKSLGYNLLRAFADPNTRASYNKAQVRGKLPEDGAVIIAPNHTSTLMDAMIVLRTRKEPTVFGARADIFKKPAIAKFLRYIRIVPMARIRDGAQSVLKNIETFAEVDEVLAHGVPFCIFPEGRHRPMHSLLPIGKGIARIAFASAAKRPTVVVPTGIDYTDFFHYRGDVVLRFGEPISVNDFLAAHAEDGEAVQYQAFLDELFQRISGLITYLPDAGHYEQRWAAIEAERAKQRLPKALRWALAAWTAPFFVLAALLTLPMWGIAELLCRFKIKDKAFCNTVRYALLLVGTPLMLLVWGLVLGLTAPWWVAVGGCLYFLCSYSIFYDWLNLVRE
jgi:1-acyl-sn-glycerol-3-phosphate acyltransferase